MILNEGEDAGTLPLLKVRYDASDQRFIDPILGCLAQKVIDLFLKCPALLAFAPAVPVFDPVPGADNQVLSLAIQATEGLAGDVARLTGRQGAQADD